MPPRIFLSAGEASGDHYGAQLITALRRLQPGATFFGLGGTQMESAGLERIIRAEDVAVMGITEVLLHLPRIYGAYRRLVNSIRANPPQIAVLIDYPDVNLRLARHLKKLGVPVVYLVSPQLWAWKKNRLATVQELVSKMLVIFPFEEPFYRARGVQVEFIGHPLADEPPTTVTREQLAEQTISIPEFAADPLDASKPWIALLPGSRVHEIMLNLPEMVRAAHQLGAQYEFVVPLAPTLSPQQIEKLGSSFGSSLMEAASPARISFVKDAAAALFHSRAAIVASGTATVLAALIGRPFIVVYKTSAITYAIAKNCISYPPEIPAPLDEDGNVPVAMVNLIAGRRIVPELLQDRFTADNILGELLPLLQDTPERAAMITGLDDVRHRLRPLETPAIERAAAAVVSLLNA
ncbi:MAG TPA: lipid-A-disaccharide synthase [Acidobacteriaceae bacterium]